MILTNYKRPYIVNTLTYVDVFVLSRQSLDKIVGNDEFPETKVRLSCYPLEVSTTQWSRKETYEKGHAVTCVSKAVHGVCKGR